MIKKKCSKPTCATLIPARQRTPYCEEHTPKGYGQGYKKREKKYADFYNSMNWRRLRKTVQLKYHGLCAECFKYGDVVSGDVVHHITEIKTEEGWRRRFDMENLILLCHSCHNKIHTEKGGKRIE